MSNSYDPRGYSPPGSSVHGISQAGILEWVDISFSRGSSWHRDQTWVSCIAGRFFTYWAMREVPDNLLVFPYYLGHTSIKGSDTNSKRKCACYFNRCIKDLFFNIYFYLFGGRSVQASETFSWGMGTQLRHAGSSFLTRDGTLHCEHGVLTIGQQGKFLNEFVFLPIPLHITLFLNF